MRISLNTYGLSGNVLVEAETAEEVTEAHKKLKPLIRELRKPLPNSTSEQATSTPGNVVGLTNSAALIPGAARQSRPEEPAE